MLRLTQFFRRKFTRVRNRQHMSGAREVFVDLFERKHMASTRTESALAAARGEAATPAGERRITRGREGPFRRAE